MSEIFKPGLYAGKVVFVTGGSSGINLGIAEAFGRLGARVAINGRKVEKLEAAVQSLRTKGITAEGFAADVRDYAALDGALESAVKALADRPSTAGRPPTSGGPVIVVRAVGARKASGGKPRRCEDRGREIERKETEWRADARKRRIDFESDMAKRERDFRKREQERWERHQREIARRWGDTRR